MERDLRGRLRSLLLQAGAYEKDKRFVFFDRVWHMPEALKMCSELVCQYIFDLDKQLGNLIPEDRTKLVILSPDAVRSNYGIIPVSILVAQEIGCRFAIWKELADFKWGTSEIRCSETPGLSCIALQDVVSRGHTALRMAYAMKELEWNFRIYLAAVLNNEDTEYVAKNTMPKVEPILGQIPKFEYIISAQELG